MITPEADTLIADTAIARPYAIAVSPRQRRKGWWF